MQDTLFTLRFLVFDLRHQRGKPLVLHLDGLIYPRVDALVICRVPLAQVLVKLVAAVLKHLPSVKKF